jgi:hypothetical protein
MLLVRTNYPFALRGMELPYVSVGSSASLYEGRSRAPGSPQSADVNLADQDSRVVPTELVKAHYTSLRSWTDGVFRVGS